MFPYDAQSFGASVQAATSTNKLIESDSFPEGFTILGIYLSTNSVTAGNSATLVCGGTEMMQLDSRAVIKNEAYLLQQECNSDLNLVINGASQRVSYNITYVPYSVNSSTTTAAYLSTTQNVEFLIIVIITFIWILFIAMVSNKIFKKLW